MLAKIKIVFASFLILFTLAGCSSNDSVSEQEMESILNISCRFILRKEYGDRVVS
jgi:uncharacterized protein YcfL